MATTDQTIGSAIQQQLLEPQDGGASWPSGLWTRDEVLAALNETQDGFLSDSLLLVGIANLAVAIGVKRVTLPDDWLKTLSAVWRGNDGTVRELLRSDSFEADHGLPTWESTNAAYPLLYMDEETPTTQIQIAPGPTVAGTLELLYIPLGTTLTGNGEILVVPDELESTIRYGAMQILLSKDGRGKDVGRAAYCQQRYDLGLEAAKLILDGWA